VANELDCSHQPQGWICEADVSEQRSQGHVCLHANMIAWSDWPFCISVCNGWHHCLRQLTVAAVCISCVQTHGVQPIGSAGICQLAQSVQVNSTDYTLLIRSTPGKIMIADEHLHKHDQASSEQSI